MPSPKRMEQNGGSRWMDEDETKWSRAKVAERQTTWGILRAIKRTTKGRTELHSLQQRINQEHSAPKTDTKKVTSLNFET